MADKYSTVTIRESQESKSVKIGSDLKPIIASSIIDNWQLLLDTVAKVIDVPSGLIMRLNEDNIEVILKSQTNGNPYHVGEKANLVYGLYCETVIGKQKEFLVPNATKNPIWAKNNPDVEINMISYMGYPINWPDGEVFGTVCLLDKKENYYNDNFKALLRITKEHIEADLQLIFSKQELEKVNKELEEMGSVKTRFLSLISHDLRGGIGTLNEFLKLIISEYDNYDIIRLKSNLISLSQSTESTYLLLENLLNWAKSDLLQLEPEKTQVDIIKILDDLVDYFQQSIEMKEIEVVSDFFASKVFVHVDEKMIKSAFINIFSNAIKYNENKGKIYLRIKEKDRKVVVEIEDTGIGMNDKEINDLFSYSKSHKTEGTQGESSAGLGLLLTKDFLEKNSAIVVVKSTMGKGTKFEITI